MKKSNPTYPANDGSYQNADPAHDIPGSIPNADFFNQVEQEILNVIAAAGIEQSEQDTTQLQQAIASLILKESSKVRYQSLYQGLKPVLNGVVNVEDEKIIGWAEVSGATTFTFDLSKCSKTGENDVITFELYINMPTPVGIVWPSNIDWGEDGAPDMTEGRLYLLTFRYLNKFKRWQASINKDFSVTSV